MIYSKGNFMFIIRRKNWRKEAAKLPDVNLAVYIITFEDPAITAFKIGVSNNVGRRLATLQTGCPWRLQVSSIQYRPDAYDEESRLHSRYRKYRIRQDGEWFDFGPGIDPVAVVTGSVSR